MGDSESESNSEEGMVGVQQGEASNDSSDEDSELKTQAMIQNGVGGDDGSENVEGSESDEGEGGQVQVR